MSGEWGVGGDKVTKGENLQQVFPFSLSPCPLPNAHFQDICGLRRCQVVDCS